MEKEARKTEIINRLKASKEPLSGSYLAKELGVSRQIIVGDIGLLRAEGRNIMALGNGYVLDEKENEPRTAVIKVKHRMEDTYDELCTIIDEGARIANISVVSDIYGKVTAELELSSRADVKAFMEKYIEAKTKDLPELTGGVHYHTITAENDLILIRVQKALHDKGYIVK